ncbi:hypothetical protein JAAARDRAFT_206637 [Jaapia argillacea MUCL 33604]|uniref:DUF6593 domain-containing protein n=1 Tax=Jaapia argillacea MUCL 33604 TaxID=933084 RepID=A0A067PVE1_9AGAM|nr:hypothetical protein JAAARDRAFT_206637 [Jaapia argillacea MUCL 33604]
MDTGHNPFGDWALSGSASYGPPPSVFGALPYPQSNSSAGVTTLTFTAMNPNILDCLVIDAQSTVQFRVSSNTSPVFSGIRDAGGTTIALIEWRAHPTVEIRGIVLKQDVQSWLALTSGTQSPSRLMTIGNQRYYWVPVRDDINLYTTASTPQVIASINRGSNAVTLSLYPTAMEPGLMKACVVATVLLQSARNID